MENNPVILSLRNSKHVVVAVVICGQRADEALVMIKSAIVFQRESQLTFVILAEFQIQENLHSRVCISTNSKECNRRIPIVLVNSYISSCGSSNPKVRTHFLTKFETSHFPRIEKTNGDLYSNRVPLNAYFYL